MKFGHANAKEVRSTSLAIDLWIKTYQNAQDSQIDPKANWGYFCGKFRISPNQRKNWEVCGRNKIKSVATMGSDII